MKPTDAALELIHRRTIRKNLTEWCKLCGFVPAAHHKMMIEALEAIERGELQRLAIFLPPGSAKSTYASVLFPAHYLSQNPHSNIIAASHTTELAERFSRRVRNLCNEHSATLGILPDPETQAAGRWGLQAIAGSPGAEYYAAGVGTGIAGFRAKLGIIDDPVRSRQDADSELIRDRTWEWYINDWRTRLVPGAAECLISCMTGDTPVLMAGGREKPLRDVRIGDRVATYEDGKVSTSVVRNWINHGPDRVYRITMNSGNTVKANARHPFLVEQDGKTKWRRTASLEKGNLILRVIGVNGRGLAALQKNAISRPDLKACACRTTISIDGKSAFDRLRSILQLTAKLIYATVTGLTHQSMNGFLTSRVAFAPFASSLLLKRIPALTISSSSTTATIAKRSEDFFATTATLQSVMATLRKSLTPPLTTFEITSDEIDEIVDGGVEDVFDIEVERTENFIANGLVSHNTRWHEDDLAGRALNHQAWHVIRLPALAEPSDPLGRPEGWPLWNDDEYGYGGQLQELAKNTPPRTWSALYQQAPTPDTGDYFKEDWLKPYVKAPARGTMQVYGASDYAVTMNQGDFTVHVVAGLDPAGNLYLLDMWRGQKSSDIWVSAWCDLVKQWNPIGWAEEQGQIKSGVGPFLTREARERRAYCARSQFATRGDKASRAQSIRGMMAMNGLYVPITKPWYPAFRSELLSFPAGKNDDICDSLGLLGQLLDQMSSGRVPKTAEAKEPDDYRPASDEFNLQDYFDKSL